MTICAFCVWSRVNTLRKRSGANMNVLDGLNELYVVMHNLTRLYSYVDKVVGKLWIKLDGCVDKVMYKLEQVVKKTFQILWISCG